MRKMLVAVLTGILVFAFSPAGSAHTGLLDSTPGDGDTVEGGVYELVLEFNTKIEATSTANVLDTDEEEIELGNIQVSDHLMTIGLNSPLENGTYTVQWKIIGADGHPIEGDYSFRVNKEDADEPANIEESKEAADTAGEKEGLEENIPSQPVEAASKIASNDVLVIILVALFTIAGGFFGWMIGRRQK